MAKKMTKNEQKMPQKRNKKWLKTGLKMNKKWTKLDKKLTDLADYATPTKMHNHQKSIGS